MIRFLFRVQGVLQCTYIPLFYCFLFYGLFWFSSFSPTFLPDRAYVYFPPFLSSSSFAIQLARASGATVIVTSSSDAKLEIAHKLGAKHGINYKTNLDWEKEVLKVVSPSYACFIASAFLPVLPFNLIYLLNRIFHEL